MFYGCLRIQVWEVRRSPSRPVLGTPRYHEVTEILQQWHHTKTVRLFRIHQKCSFPPPEYNRIFFAGRPTVEHNSRWRIHNDGACFGPQALHPHSRCSLIPRLLTVKVFRLGELRVLITQNSNSQEWRAQLKEPKKINLIVVSKFLVIDLNRRDFFRPWSKLFIESLGKSTSSGTQQKLSSTKPSCAP